MNKKKRFILSSLQSAVASALFINSDGIIKLDYPMQLGYGSFASGGDIYIDTTDADKNVMSKIKHKDFWPPVFTTDPGVDILIYEAGGTTRLYDSADPLPEYQPAVNNEIFIVRDNSDDPVSEILIVITN
jgi:hypothetical protein